LNTPALNIPDLQALAAEVREKAKQYPRGSWPYKGCLRLHESIQYVVTVLALEEAREKGADQCIH
jgi:hypothetical protein